MVYAELDSDSEEEEEDEGDDDDDSGETKRHEMMRDEMGSMLFLGNLDLTRCYFF